MSDKHLVLDLDNTLICSTFEAKDLNNLSLDNIDNKILFKRMHYVELVDGMDNDVRGTGEITPIIVVLRPYVYEFLEFAISYFSEISVWSAGQDRYVRAIISLLFPRRLINGNRKIPHKIYSRNDCVILSSGATFKELVKKEFDLNKTLVLDDREDTFSKNTGCGILIPEYKPIMTKNGILNDDTALLQLKDWLLLDQVKNSQNVQELDKSTIFKKHF